MKRPLFIGAICMAVSAITVCFFPEVLPIVCAGVLIVIALLILLHYYKAAFCVALCLIMLNNFSNLQNEIEINDTYADNLMTLDFVATGDIKYFEDYQTVEVITVTEKGISKNQKFTVFGNFDIPLNCGDVFRAEITLKSVKTDKNKFYYYSNEHYMKASLKNFVGIFSENRFYKMVGNLRRYIIKTVDKNFSTDNAILVKGILLGDKSTMSDKVQDTIRRSGVSHVVVVSGMHLSIIMMGIFALLDRLFYNRYVRFIISFVAVVMIASLCGFTMSIIRAGIMYVIMMLSPLFDRDSDSLSALSFTVIILLLECPYIIFNISFELSVLATFSVISVTQFYSALIKEKLSLKNKKLCGIVDTALITVFAMLYTMPVSIYRFGGVSLVAVLTNLLITVAVSVLLLITFAGLLINTVAFLNTVSRLVFFVADKISTYVLFVINTLGKLKWAYINCPQYVAFIVAAIDVLLFLFCECFDIYKLRKLKEGEKNNAGNIRRSIKK